MLPVSPYEVKRMADMRVEEALRRAEHHRLLRGAGRGRLGGVLRQVCRPLRQVGRLLVALGRRLQQLGLPQPALLEGQRTSVGSDTGGWGLAR